MKNLLLILLATLFVACNERARHDDGSLKYITVDFSKESSKERFTVNNRTLLILALPAIGVLLIMGFQNKFGEQELDENGKPRPKHPASIEDFLPI